jgi:negative regulator of flagellin synthesis FlgM
MKIDNSINSAGAPAPKDGASKPATTDAAATPAAPSAGDAVNLSAVNSQVQSVSASLADVPVVNRAQVNEIKQAISEGRFKVNPEVVADKLLDTVRELIRNKTA